MVSGVLVNKELENNIPSIRRDPILADIFARMKFMDRRGSGFDKIVNVTSRLFNDNKKHVEFYATETHFSVVIYNANYRDDKANDKVSDKVNDKVKISDNTEKILNAIINYICGARMIKQVLIVPYTF